MRVGVEVGGTFTDLVSIGEDGVSITKVPSTPGNPDDGALAAIDEARIPLGDVEDLIHGSTVATNAILERKGAPVAFLVTSGFRDILLLQRHNRRQIYDLAYKKPASVVDRRDTFEISERIAADGSAIEGLDEAAVAVDLQRAIDPGRYRSVAICLLNSYANTAHEKALQALVRRLFPGLAVVCSSDVSREFREYERASTTALAAYVQPVIEQYLSRFQSRLQTGGFHGRFSIMQSSGGSLPTRGAVENAVTSLFSGPAAGVIGAVRQAELSGVSDLITIDMGGTSTDICLVANGQPDLVSESEVDGLPVRIPLLDIVTVGAGGGSIIWRDEGGMLRVGPRFAGAVPGPACYLRGGLEPTITDAHMVRGFIRAASFLGGRMEVDARASATALTGISKAFGTTLEQLADNAVRVADSNVVRAIQLVSTERGRDPRDYTLVPYGGAGPLHAARVAEELNMGKVLVPPNAGVISAYGLVASNYTTYDARTHHIPVDAHAPEAVRAMFDEMSKSSRLAFDEMGVTGELRHTYALEMRYVGQAFEVPVGLDSGQIEKLTVDLLLGLLHEAHQQVFEFGSATQGAAEIIAFRLGTGPMAEPSVALVDRESVPASTSERVDLFDGGRHVSSHLRHRMSLSPGETMAGPVLIEDETSTIYIPGGWRGAQDDNGNLVMTQER